MYLLFFPDIMLLICYKIYNENHKVILKSFAECLLLTFKYLLNKIDSIVAKYNTNMRYSIPIQERLTVAFRLFDTRDSYRNL